MQKLEIKIGETTFIKLESLAASGYLWDYTVNDNSIIHLEKKANEFKTPPAAGFSGMEVFAIKALKKGTAKILFSQSRKWDNNTEPVKSRYFNIIVSGE